ncbi:MAG: hypothetical protein COZ46_04390 [Verrucomicrobia bacterium CG_4_10_14_3_um_filter_43_23]|nr:MAG: hypothetical protein AUJ82_08540 [Verrucomicrobia bacterium CG1_02_43_26]PIP58529.1 MAG: hypothetical protein COX01_08420 [Verrucomicrobia bacterium CG22_combo_CG10-13_8_21_14_all_43_17]PIX58327.1 MAG: hypothetical protein COZ46_04390 [Verrucomicrobia bacterium CG_4_10_14_3_um_filter_43_23]PIY60854.1 MAG: hypothetical protein COY94_08440 [Verrucomicrobia bacterium CG_4_10_14_0_8_um_filter_43_34]PJA44344.1 MAG: hypothetical protein CO175_03405 [Verrucomicrobia bacterium CG_4_9_14_3_um_fi
MIQSKIIPESQHLCITIDGDLLSTNVKTYGTYIKRTLDEEIGYKAVAVDLNSAEILDSVGLNMLVSLAKILAEKSVILKIFVSSPSILKVMRFSRIDKVAEIVYAERVS